MDATAALATGLVAGLAIAAQVGAVSLLLVDTALANGPRVAVAAGMGVATADFAFAVLAAVGGGGAGAALAGHEAEIHLVAGATLAVIAVHGLVTLAREERDGAGARTDVAGASTAMSERSATSARGARTARAYYARFLAITAVNPLTIASFAAVAASLSLHGLAPYAAFVAGVGIASGGWHIFLTLTAAHVGRWITPSVQRGLGIAGRVAILLLAARLAFAA